MSEDKIEELHQQRAFEAEYAKDPSVWEFHRTQDRLTRFLRDRRLRIVMDELRNSGFFQDPAWPELSVLVVCGGVGGEGSFLANEGFRFVTVSDFSRNSIDLAKQFDPRLDTLLLDAEKMTVPDESFDLVLVQDGLHHLRRPILGLTEMLRVARRAVVVIEPHHGLVGNWLGIAWESVEDTVNHVFRWNRLILEQSTNSYLLRKDVSIKVIRFWDHHAVIGNAVRFVPTFLRPFVAKGIYALLSPFNRLGNMMVGVVLKGVTVPPAEALSTRLARILRPSLRIDTCL